MKIDYRTEQESFWAGQFGDEYAERNRGEGLLASNLALFSRVLERCADVRSVLEFGANIGMNLAALRLLVPGVALSAIEINHRALAALERQGGVRLYSQSILDFQPDFQRDLVLIKGVLIHINPEQLTQVYDRLYQSSARYICIAEYYNPTPVALSYRGHDERLFKRDFAGEMLDRFPDLRLVDYGFSYHRDRHFPQDDITWFVLEKSGMHQEQGKA
ncbi:MAG: pseudaminic acid biosynthesis-associated methylase [Telluria sp.]